MTVYENILVTYFLYYFKNKNNVGDYLYLHELKEYSCNYVTDGTLHGFYSLGIFYDYNSNKVNEDLFIGFMIGRGLPELIEGGYGYFDCAPLYEPVEYEIIKVRPKLKYPRRCLKNK